MELYKVEKMLESRGITSESLANIVYENQITHNPELVQTDAYMAVGEVMANPIVQDYIFTMLLLDELVENNHVDNKYQSLANKIANDDPMFGVDEHLAFGIASLYGTIATTNYGYEDRMKRGIIGELDQDKEHINTFADDLAGAIIAAAASVLANEQLKVG